MFKLKTLFVVTFIVFAFTACQNNTNNTAADDAVKNEEANIESEEDGDKKLKYDMFEESITSKVSGLKVVQKKNHAVDSMSNGENHLSYRVIKDTSRANVYTVIVSEQSKIENVDYFHFHVDSLTGNILNPDGK